MEAFTTHTGLAVPLDRANVDTDQIIPKQFLKRIERTGFGEFLFYDWRFDETGELKGSFVLDQAGYRGASVLIAGENFGCGSSREHAVWALQEFGFRAIIAPSFADIFANNAMKNGLLPVAIPAERVAVLMQRAQSVADYRVTVSLQERTVSDASGFRQDLVIDEIRRAHLLFGSDEIALTLRHETVIREWEIRRREHSWLR